MSLLTFYQAAQFVSSSFSGQRERLPLLANMSNLQRIMLRKRNPNPLFLQWLNEWKLQGCIKSGTAEYKIEIPQEAVDSLHKYPLTLETGDECLILEGFSPYLCQALNCMLAKHNKQKQAAAIPIAQPTATEYTTETEEPISKKKKPSTKNPTKEKLPPKPKKQATTKAASQKPKTQANKPVAPDQNPTDWSHILLVVDTQETAGSSKKSLDVTLKLLDTQKVPHFVQRLSMGDFTWILCNASGDERSNVMLPYVVERKRLDDLSASLRDGRFLEQKSRLKLGGFQSVIYLIEHYNKQTTFGGISIDALHQAVSNIEIQNGTTFMCKVTYSHVESMQYLGNLTNVFMAMHSSGSIAKYFNFDGIQRSGLKTKVPQVREMFLRQLLQLKGLSEERAMAIVKIHKTPVILKRNYALCKTEREKADLLKGILYGKFSRPIGAAISKVIYDFYCLYEFENKL